MKNLWSNSDAKAAINAHAKKGIGEDLALRVYTSRLLGGEPKLVLHGGGNTSVKTRMPDITGADDRRAVRQGQRLGHGRRSSRPACPPCGWRRCASCAGCRRCPTRTWCNVQRANLLDPERAQPVGRDAAARLPAAQIHRPHAFQRRAGAGRPARRRRALAPSSTASALGLVPYIMPGFALAKKCRRGRSRPTRDVEGLVLLKHGIFTFGETARRGLRAHDRPR